MNLCPFICNVPQYSLHLTGILLSYASSTQLAYGSFVVFNMWLCMGNHCVAQIGFANDFGVGPTFIGSDMWSAWDPSETT